MLQVRAKNEKLRQERAITDAAEPRPGPSNVTPALPIDPLPANSGVPAAERFMFIPRDHRCPKFNGKAGMGIN